MGSQKGCIFLKKWESYKSLSFLGILGACEQLTHFFKFGNKFGKAAAQWLCCRPCYMALETKCCPWESSPWILQGGMWHGACLRHQWSTAGPMWLPCQKHEHGTALGQDSRWKSCHHWNTQLHLQNGSVYLWKALQH